MAQKQQSKKTDTPTTETAPPKVPPQHDSFESPESSTIVSAHYDGQTMIVYFQRAANRDHQRYDYTNFPSELWERFKQAESKGAFFSAHIRPFYAGRRFV